ncbi:hypothetical protein FOPG_18770 [Fusarium oxysporum f. sp. conglutinans race 2 54008]|uniref:Uncharacterized protein n=1 Tax=Fusarium oxysporum f. sp. conglutinans race 2 54008 TaxID=1089457 RepID=X0GYT6_FUSOX|nr:hypothetical protein FOPG_18770 [Fusarium oxysporum f. sp. conglutinans race 2 54008]
MDLILVCLFVFLADLCFWIPLSRLPGLRQKLTDRIAGPKRKEKKSDIVDDHDLTGFAPPHKTRAIISIVVAAENILLLLYAFMSEKSIRGVSIGSGKLALANLFPLFLFGSHEIILVKVLRHSKQQVLWAHSLFAWIAWYEMEVHVATSLFLVSGMTSWNSLIGCIMGFLTSLALVGSLVRSFNMTERVHRTFHGVIAIIGILGGTIHLLQSISCLLLVLATVCLGVTGIHSLWRPYSMPNAILAVGIDDSLDMKEAVELKFRVPDSKHDFYIETSGTFYRAVYVAARDSGGCEATVLLPLSTLKSRKNHGSLQYHGPFRAPLSPYIYLSAKLDIITTGSGIIEGFSCFRWRQRVAESENKTPVFTRLVWLTTKSCPPYLSYYMNDMSWEKEDATILVIVLGSEVMGSKHVNSCSDSILNESIVLDKQDDDEKTRNEKNAHERNDINNNASLHSFQAKMTIKYEIQTDMKYAIKKYLKEPSRRRYVIGESLRALLQD